MVMPVLKHDGQWNMIRQVLKIKGPQFESLKSKFVKIIAEKTYAMLVTEVSKNTPMPLMCNEKQLFSNFPYARYTTDVTFQHANIKSGNMEEGKNNIVENINYMDKK